ncbi:MAG TPA: hypothetical protein VE155_06540 [Pseudonocardiaceae bacterium]|nr:hypothetical protein [Pseudonocardiaceae bacterium]
MTIEDRFNLRARVAAEPPGRYIGLWQINTGAPGRAATWESTWRPPTASDSVKIARIRKLVTEWERRSRATTGDPFLGGMATALHEVAGELKSILDDPDPVVAAHAARWPKDCRTGVPCPKCSAEIVYNGSYFCSHFSLDCDWVMSEGDTGILFTRCNEGLLTNRMSP